MPRQRLSWGAPPRRVLLLLLLALLSAAALAPLGCDDDGASPDDDTASDTAADTAPDTGDDTAAPDTTDDTAADTVVPDGEDDADTAPSDTTAPELRDVRVTLPGARGPVTLDINLSDVERVLPAAGLAELTVFARDDVSAADALVVEAVDPSGNPLPGGSTPVLRNGLWSLELEVTPGEVVHVAVTDEAGNTTVSEHAVVLTPHEEALVATWLQRSYDTTQAVIGTTSLTLAGDATFTLDVESGLVVATGTWSIADGELTLEVRTNTNPDNPDDDPTTVELVLRSTYYVDETHFSPRAWRRTSAEDSGATGTWAQSLTEGDAVETATLELADDGSYVHTVEGGFARTETGTWEIVVSENYEETAGDFLSRTLTGLDGAPVDPPQTGFDLVKVTPDFLLVGASIRAD